MQGQLELYLKSNGICLPEQTSSSYAPRLWLHRMALLPTLQSQVAIRFGSAKERDVSENVKLITFADITQFLVSRACRYSTWIVSKRSRTLLARFVARQRKFDHVTPLLNELHWLPVRSRVNFKVATLAFKVQSTGQPSYLAPLIVRHIPTRDLRSASDKMLVVPRTKT